MATVILLIQVPQKTMSEDTKTLTKGSYAIRADFASAAIISNSGNRNHIEPGLSQDGIRLRDEQKRLAEEAEKKKRETIARERPSTQRYGSSYTGNGTAKVIGYSNEQCVVYFKRMAGINRSLGYAGYIKPQGQIPKVGSGALESGHISYVVAVEEGYVIVHEANYLRGRITERKISLSHIRGFLYN